MSGGNAVPPLFVESALAAQAAGTFQCDLCNRIADIEERHGGRDTHPGDWCDDCSVGPGWSVRRG